MVSSVEEIVAACDRYGDRLRGTYRAHYRFDATTIDPYTAPRLERPEALAGNPPDAIYPWEQIFLAAAACAGSDYPMLAAHFGIPLERVDFVVEGVFDPRGEFDGLAGFQAPPDARHSTVRCTSAPRCFHPRRARSWRGFTSACCRTTWCWVGSVGCRRRASWSRYRRGFPRRWREVCYDVDGRPMV
jgi:hypothetical protein